MDKLTTESAVGFPKGSLLCDEEGFPEGVAFELGLQNEVCQIGGVALFQKKITCQNMNMSENTLCLGMGLLWQDYSPEWCSS